MSISPSEPVRPASSRAIPAMVAVLLLCALGFYALQNQVGIIGGQIALSKMIWLTYAILFWFGLPLFLAWDRQIAKPLRQAFQCLLLLMAARGVIELVMLYLFNNWSPLYGITHDLMCMLGLVFFLACAARDHQVLTLPSNRLVLLHGVVTALLFIPEIYFAWYMRSHFNTQGGHAVYFVPATAAHNRVLHITAGVDVAVTMYLCLFLRKRFYVKT